MLFDNIVKREFEIKIDIYYHDSICLNKKHLQSGVLIRRD